MEPQFRISLTKEHEGEICVVLRPDGVECKIKIISVRSSDATATMQCLDFWNADFPAGRVYTASSPITINRWAEEAWDEQIDLTEEVL